ncbi:MAG TPA: PP2C family protein-serine/threonine phosphatase [Phycisphaerales bacterium]|nr:PP2C family protein-serine/threonine phosphatase [Phycisphaerales bacterium]
MKGGSQLQGGVLPREFVPEFEAARRVWLKRRFLWFAGASAGVLTVAAVLLAGKFWRPGAAKTMLELALPVFVLMQAGVFALYFERARRMTAAPERRVVLRWVGALIVVFTLSSILTAFPFSVLLTEWYTGLFHEVHFGPGVPLMLGTGLVHLAAALLMPWTVREAIKPVLPFVVLYTGALIAARFVQEQNPGIGFTVSLFLMMVGTLVPGLLVSAARDWSFVRRFTTRRVRERYEELSGELALARRIHDRLFPAPVDDGTLRFSYSYEPMREIGGDLVLLAGALEPGEMHIAIVDVTGHGIAAALAVNRIHGEVRRITGRAGGEHGKEGHAVSPGELLRELNEYVALTMTPDGMYATALCLSVSAREGTLRWASAGHPPAFVVVGSGADGGGKDGAAVKEVGSTTLPLGAVTGEDFDPSEESMEFGAGDVLVAYTDGAIEARNPAPAGNMLGVEGLTKLIALERSRGVDGLADRLQRELAAYRGGPAQDDTLFVVVERAG